MNIELKEIAIREVINGYSDRTAEDGGITGYDGRLNIRPAYQREFVYKDKQRDAVIETINKGFPLNVMYWMHDTDTDNYEVLDGQQRTISFCQYIKGAFSLENRYFHNLTKAEQDLILDYTLMVYICEGNDKEKLDWFRIINIAGEKLTEQELRNAVYTGPWLEDAKRFFSKRDGVAYKIGQDYMKGVPIRQEYLETVLEWKARGQIEDYMAVHQHDLNANDLTLYFQSVISWVQTIFPKKRKEMKGIAWGLLYDKFHNVCYNQKELEEKIKILMQDSDVTSKSGIYEFLLDGDEKHLSVRAFDGNMKREAYEKQSGICSFCGKHFELEEMEADHITPWSKGGKTIADNCQMLCRDCNRKKSGK